GTVLPILLCPSDSLPTPPRYVGNFYAGGNIVARSSYGANTGYGGNVIGTGPFDGTISLSTPGYKLLDITDGTSHTIMLGEHWSLQQADFDNIPDPFFVSFVQGLDGWAVYPLEVNSQVKVNFRLSDGPPMDLSTAFDRLVAHGSGHPGGTNVAFADGS